MCPAASDRATGAIGAPEVTSAATRAGDDRPVRAPHRRDPRKVQLRSRASMSTIRRDVIGRDCRRSCRRDCRRDVIRLYPPLPSGQPQRDLARPGRLATAFNADLHPAPRQPAVPVSDPGPVPWLRRQPQVRHRPSRVPTWARNGSSTDSRDLARAPAGGARRRPAGLEPVPRRCRTRRASAPTTSAPALTGRRHHRQPGQVDPEVASRLRASRVADPFGRSTSTHHAPSADASAISASSSDSEPLTLTVLPRRNPSGQQLVKGRMHRQCRKRAHRAAAMAWAAARGSGGGAARSSISAIIERMFELMSIRCVPRPAGQSRFGATAAHHDPMALDLPCPNCGTQMYAEQAHNRCPGMPVLRAVL